MKRFAVALTCLVSLTPLASHSYEGHGAGSIAAETVKKFAPTPLTPEVSRRVQLALDIRSPGGGQAVLAPDASKMYFAWNVTGGFQSWRLDGPNHSGSQPAALP